jgi:hypothetical protein
MTSVRLDSTHRVNALVYSRSVGLHDAPYAKVLSHLRFLAIPTLRLARKEASIESPAQWNRR